MVSIDMPSGMSADTSDLIGDAIEADGHGHARRAEDAAGAAAGGARGRRSRDGRHRHSRRRVRSARRPADRAADARADAPADPAARADAHKGDFGRVLVVAGSRGKAGAAVLCAQGAMRAGAGLVTVATPESCQPTWPRTRLEYMTEGARRDGGRAPCILRRSSGAAHRGRRDRRGPRTRPRRRRDDVRSRAGGEVRAARSCSTPMRSTRLPTSRRCWSAAKAAT